MDGSNVSLVKSNAAALACRAFDIADEFLNKLRAECPEVAAGFVGTRRHQRRSVVLIFAWVAKNLGSLPSISGDLAAMGRRLGGLGFDRHHAAAATRALLAALSKHTGTAWSAKLAAAWNKALEEIFQAMGLADPIRSSRAA